MNEFITREKPKVLEYFERHPEARDVVLKAYYAWHAPHFRLEPFGHNFTSANPDSACVWCKRTRNNVRWDDLPGRCANRPKMLPVEDVIHEEEKKYDRLLQKAKVQVPLIVNRFGMSGQILAVLHHTHGYDPETVAGALNTDTKSLPMAEYEVEMAKHNETGGKR